MPLNLFLTNTWNDVLWNQRALDRFSVTASIRKLQNCPILLRGEGFGGKLQHFYHEVTVWMCVWCVLECFCVSAEYACACLFFLFVAVIYFFVFLLVTPVTQTYGRQRPPEPRWFAGVFLLRTTSMRLKNTTFKSHVVLSTLHYFHDTWMTNQKNML